MNGAWTSTTSRSSTRRARPILGAGFNIKPIFDDHIGSLKAIDPVAQKVVWEYKNKAPLWGGVLTTAGGLVFTGTPEGYLKAFDAKTGDELWKFNVGTGIVAPPIAWEQDGEEMIGVSAGWGGAVPLWGGEVGQVQGNRPGRLLLGVQAAPIRRGQVNVADNDASAIPVRQMGRIGIDPSGGGSWAGGGSCAGSRSCAQVR